MPLFCFEDGIDRPNISLNNICPALLTCPLFCHIILVEEKGYEGRSFSIPLLSKSKSLIPKFRGALCSD